MQKKKKKKEDDPPPQPANCSYFICKASNEKYFKWLLSLLYYSVFASCPSAIWQVSLFMNEIGSLSFRFLWWRCIFYSLSFLLFLALFDKKKKKKNDRNDFFFFFIFLHFGCCSFFFSLASSICLCHDALFISNLHNNNNNKKMKINHSSDVCSFIYLLSRLVVFSEFLGVEEKRGKNCN